MKNALIRLELEMTLQARPSSPKGKIRNRQAKGKVQLAQEQAPSLVVGNDSKAGKLSSQFQACTSSMPEKLNVLKLVPGSKANKANDFSLNRN